MWQWKDDSLHIVPKLSYVSIFKPWNWVIGTGVYIEDVKKEITCTYKKNDMDINRHFHINCIYCFILSNKVLNIERKRIQAENELHESKEKYQNSC